MLDTRNVSLAQQYHKTTTYLKYMFGVGNDIPSAYWMSRFAYTGSMSIGPQYMTLSKPQRRDRSDHFHRRLLGPFGM